MAVEERSESRNWKSNNSSTNKILCNKNIENRHIAHADCVNNLTSIIAAYPVLAKEDT
jgi:hypothetical protein